MGSQPIRMELRKILRENLAGKSCGKFLVGNYCRKILWEIVVGKSCGKYCGKFLWENLVGNFLRENLVGNSCGKSCGKFLRENLAEKGGGEKANLRKAVMRGNLAFGIG